MTHEELDALKGALQPLLPADELPRAQSLFVAYLSELVGWNIRSNLVAAGDHTRLVRRHVAESLASVPLLDELKGRTLIDLGSGGGFPGIPIKLVRPELEVALVESRRMKSLFLRRAIEQLDLKGIAAWQVRVEHLAALPLGPPSGAGHGPLIADTASSEGPSLRPQVELVTSRAVAPLAKTAEWVAPLVRPGGHLVTFKGSRLDEEIRAWETRRGPWTIAEIRRDVLPGLTLLALERLVDGP